ncbi:MAG: DUF2804 family protein [Eggerthellaceae bacterium]|nr:DUF2804 family protein [Eggerthellaceae bacterium]
MFEPLSRVRQMVTAKAQKAQLRMLPELVLGPGSLYDVPDLLRDQDIRCVMVVTTEGFVRRGVIPSFTKDLLTSGITAAVFSDVKPDPDLECVEMAAAFYRSHGCEGIVAIGGGSVMDCAKVAGALAVKPGKKALDIVGTMKVHATLPYLVAVPTTAGTGSEATAAAVVTDPERQRKYAVGDLSLIPDAAVLDPNLLVGLPPAMTAYTGMDALTHAVEAYINRYGSREAYDYAREAVELVFKNLKPSFDDGANSKLRENMLIASYYAGIAFSNNMVGYVHALAHGIGGRYHVQHGLANAVLLPEVLEEFGEAAEPRLAELAEAIGLGGATDHDLATAFIARIRDLNASMGIPAAIPEIRKEDIPELAAGAEKEGNPAYPVPDMWNVQRFAKVLRRVAGSGEAQPAAENGQVRIAKPGPLLSEDGLLAQPGWATSLLLEYDRSRIAASKIRIKEWDYYLVNDGEYALAFTIGDMGYAAMVSASLIDFANGTFITESTLGVLPLGRLGLPATSALGITQYADKRVAMTFEVAGGMRRLVVNFADFKDGQPFIAEIVLDDEPRDSMVIATPWAEDDRAFYYNQKIVGMRAIGSFALGDLYHEFRDTEALGLLDWGRGVWTRDNTWYWSAAQGWQDGRRIGFNLGYGFGDTTAASENMVFVDGIAHKLGRVDFGIPVHDASAKTVGNRFDLMKPWHFTDDEGRLELEFTPGIDRCDYLDFKAIVSDQHQVFGQFNGWVILDDGTRFEIRDLRGFAEAVHNMY